MIFVVVFEFLSNFGIFLGYDCDIKINFGNKGFKMLKC